MKIIKIGGSATTKNNISLLFNNLSNYSLINTVIIISAFGTLSSELKNVTDLNSTKFLDNNIFNFLKDFTGSISGDYLNQFNEKLESVISRIQNIKEGVKFIDEIPIEIIDEVMSYGEILSSYLVYYIFKSNGIDCEYLDARRVIKTDSNFGKAKLDVVISKELIRKHIPQEKLVITQGFIGSDMLGRTTTMGFESSNLSALIFADALESKRIEIITKTDYIQTSDPEKIKKTKNVKAIPYLSAKELANNNFKLLYPGMIELALKKSITLIYRSFTNNKGTIISAKNEFDLPVILENENQIIITPIHIDKSINVVSKFKNSILRYEFDSKSHSLIITHNKIDLQNMNDYIISLF